MFVLSSSLTIPDLSLLFGDPGLLINLPRNWLSHSLCNDNVLLVNVLFFFSLSFETKIPSERIFLSRNEPKEYLKCFYNKGWIFIINANQEASLSLSLSLSLSIYIYIYVYWDYRPLNKHCLSNPKVTVYLTSWQLRPCSFNSYWSLAGWQNYASTGTNLGFSDSFYFTIVNH